MVSNNPTHFQQVLAQRMRGMRKDRKPPRPSAPPSGPPAPAAGSEPDVLTRAEAARFCRVSLSTFKTWNVPEFRRGRVVRIYRKDLEAFLRSNSIEQSTGGN